MSATNPDNLPSGRALTDLAREMGVPDRLIRQIAPGAKVNANAQAINREAFGRACEEIGQDPLIAFRLILDMLTAERAGTKVVKTVREIKEFRHTRDAETGELISAGIKDSRLIEDGIRVAAMVPDQRTRQNALVLYFKLMGLDPGQKLEVTGMGGNTTNNTVNIITPDIRTALEAAKASGDWEQLQNLYRNRMSQIASGAAAVLDAEFQEEA